MKHPGDDSFFDDFGVAKLPTAQDGRVGSRTRTDAALEWSGYDFNRTAQDFQSPDINVDELFDGLEERPFEALREDRAAATAQSGQLPAEPLREHQQIEDDSANRFPAEAAPNKKAKLKALHEYIGIVEKRLAEVSEGSERLRFSEAWADLQPDLRYHSVPMQAFRSNTWMEEPSAFRPAIETDAGVSQPTGLSKSTGSNSVVGKKHLGKKVRWALFGRRP